jgi:hypothetical protein
MPTTNSYYPSRAGDQIIWLLNLRNKLPNHKTALGYTDPEVAAVQADCDRLGWALGTLQTAAQQFSQAITTHVRLLHNGTGNAPVDPPAFTLPATPAAPANVIPGAFKRLTNFIKNMKTRSGYTATIGQDLGVIGTEQVEPDPSTTKPDIKLVLITGGKVQLQWKKLGFTGIRIEVDRGNGAWTFLDIDTKPHYEDPASPAAGATVLWKYRAIYLDGDTVFGQWSDVVSIAVTG